MSWDRRVDAASPRTLAALAALVAAILLLPHLGGDFVGDDEALDAGVVHAILDRGDWLHPEFNDSYLPPKPPLAYWLGALVSLAAGGLDEWTVRLPSVAAAVATVFVTVWFGSGAVGKGGAFLGGVFLALMPVFRDQARLGRADMTMTFFVVAALCLYGRSAGPIARRDRWVVSSLLGLAALAKGAAGVGMVAAVVAVDAWRGADRRRARSLVDPALIAFVGIGGFWYALGVAHWGDRFLFHHVVGENFRHFFGSWVADERPVRGLLHHLSHFVNVFTGTFPWGLLLPAVLLDPDARGEPNERERFLRRWLVAGFVFFTLATRKSPYYLLPIFPPIALLVGGFAWRRIVEGERDRMRGAELRRAAIVGAVVAALGGAAWLVVGGGGAGATRGEFASALLQDAVPSLLLFLAAGAGVGVALAAVRAGRARALVGAAILASFAISQLANRIEPRLAAASSLRRFGEEVARHVPEGAPLYFFELPLPAVVLYSGRTIPVLRAADAPPEPPFHLVVPESLADRLPPAWAKSNVVVADRARVFTRRRMEIRLLAVRNPSTEGEAARAAPPVPRTSSRSGGIPPPGRLVTFGLPLSLDVGDFVQVSQHSGGEHDGHGDQ